MRRLLGTGLIGLAAIALAFGFGCLFLYSGDLPNLNTLSQFTPTMKRTVSERGLTTATVAIPYDLIGSNLRAALSTLEGSEERSDVPKDTAHVCSDVLQA
jgi:hypothetical protein